MTNPILQAVAGLPRLEAVKAVVGALHTLTIDMTADDLPGIVPVVQRLVPIKKQRKDRFAPVWAYLETVQEYATQKELREQLVARFGEKGTPSRSHLHRYLKQNGREEL